MKGFEKSREITLILGWCWDNADILGFAVEYAKEVLPECLHAKPVLPEYLN